MAIDVSVRGSPGWWLARQFARLSDPRRRRRLQMLWDWQHGDAPLPDNLHAARESFRAFLRMSRTNFAGLIVSSVSERLMPVGFRTAVDPDETGDPVSAALWKRAGMEVRATEVHEMMLGLSEAYVIVGPVDPDTGAPVITAEDPRTMVGESDPVMPWRLRAALKVVYDDIDEVDRAYLYLPGYVYVAFRRNRHGLDTARVTGPLDAPKIPYFSPESWEWDPDRGGADGQRLPHDRNPVVRFVNKDGLSEFEPHLDLLSRINQVILHEMAVTALQTFRQRAISGLPLVYPEGHPLAGQEIDYGSIFAMDPAAVWQLPETAKVWESGLVDLTPILSAVKDYVQQLSAVSKTPMHALMPAGENQTAEGAAMQREGAVEKAAQHIARQSYPWAWVMSLAFLQMGDVERADLAKLEPLWRSPQRLSLAERADAASKAKDIPWRSRMLYIWEFPPDVVDRMASERFDELMFEAQVAAAAQALQDSPLAPQPQTQQQVVSTTPLPQIPTPEDPLENPLEGLPDV